MGQLSRPADGGRPARLQDVAAAAGVSTATVSRALTFPDRVKQGTRERVLKAVNTLGYAPNEAARTLRAGTSRMILVLIPQRTSEVFFAGVLAGIDAELSAQGFVMVMGSLEGSDAKARRLSDLVFARHFDGVLVVTGMIPMPDGRTILDAGVPVVAICAEIEGAALQTVLIDDEACTRKQANHLIALGHKRLMYVAGIEGGYNEVWRYRGFCQAAKEGGLLASDVFRHPGTYSLQSGVAAARCFLDMADRPTGIVCASDEMAIGFIRTIGSAGLACPRDVSVIGFDDIEFAEFCEPALTTVRQPRHDLGVTGARTLLAALQGEQVGVERRVILPAALIIRASSAAPPLSRRRTARARGL